VRTSIRRSVKTSASATRPKHRVGSADTQPLAGRETEQ
jgi:hypothetical protein